MVCAVGQETSRSRVVNTYHVSWLRPNLAWAMDDCDKNERTVDGTLHLHNLTDLHSRYRLPPLASYGLPCGEEVAGHLQYLFDRFDPPLFCKRDNGGKGTNPRKKRTLSTQRVEVQSDLDQLLFEIEVGKQVLTSPKRQDNRQVTILKTKKEEGRQ